ncbi:hypothetical protein [Streptomyces scabiei]|uniref:hypothetical protein n=1 Tax=Streptomyces scabiei TaxID=1930 RepID=UPI0029B6FCB4|nr:hypothetical protein [Streptomyces scabiei]MDX3520914.1 hypothetical protein [Streptomyces scabiei]
MDVPAARGGPQARGCGQERTAYLSEHVEKSPFTTHTHIVYPVSSGRSPVTVTA